MIALLAALLLALPALARDVVALVSDDLPEYDAPLEAFQRAVGVPVEVRRIRGDRARAERIAEDLRADPPPVIFALGAKAAWTSTHLVRRVPVVHALVMEPHRYGIDGAFVSGVDMRVPADMALAQFLLFFPDVDRVGIVVSTAGGAPVEEAVAALRAAGRTPVVRRVTRSSDVRRALRQMLAELDAIWVLPDPVVVTPDNFQLLTHLATRARIPVLAYSETLGRAGALLAVGPDLARCGEQAAELVQEVLAGRNPGVRGLVPPDIPHVVLNRDAQQAAGFRFDEGLLDFVDEVVRRAAAR